MAKLNKTGHAAFLVSFSDMTTTSQWSSGYYGHVTLTVVTKGDKYTDGHTYTVEYENLALDNVKVTCQYDREMDPYAWRVENHDVHGLREAQNAVKVQSAVEKALIKVRDTYGYGTVSTFGQYVAVVCQALGIEKVGFHGYHNHPDGILWDTPASAAERINSHIRENRMEMEKVS